MKKILWCLGCITLMFTVVTGCMEQKKETIPKKEEKKEEVKGNCKVSECINLIDIKNTVDEINQIIGFSGELKQEGSNKYYWKFSDTTGIEASISSSGGTITATIDRNTIANKKVDFSRYSEIKSLMDSGVSLTYDEFVEKVGGVQGTLVSKSSLSKRYTWVNSKGGYLNASFSEKTGKCTLVMGRY